jgi:outer membrane protein
MKNSLKSLIAIATFAAVGLGAYAQPAVKILVVDMAKLYDAHYKTVENNARIQADDQKAQEEVEKMNKEGNALIKEYTDLAEQTKNPALSADAKTKAQGEAQKKYESIQKMEQEVQKFIQHTRNQLGQRLNTFRALMLEEISKLATDIAKRKGATILLDKAGPTGIGISNVLFADPAYEITEEVLKEINKDRPATAPAPTATPTTPGAATPSSAPLTVPGVGGAKK